MNNIFVANKKLEHGVEIMIVDMEFPRIDVEVTFHEFTRDGIEEDGKVSFVSSYELPQKYDVYPKKDIKDFGERMRIARSFWQVLEEFSDVFKGFTVSVAA